MKKSVYMCLPHTTHIHVCNIHVYVIHVYNNNNRCSDLFLYQNSQHIPLSFFSPLPSTVA